MANTSRKNLKQKCPEWFFLNIHTSHAIHRYKKVRIYPGGTWELDIITESKYCIDALKELYAKF